jgi:two-component system sensor histidine kinase KdpD
VTSLRSDEVEFSPDDRDELLATADESLDKLSRLVANLLDMSRLQAGALGVVPASLGLEEAVPRALDELGVVAQPVILRMPDDLPLVHADPGLLERILVNVIGNALRYSPADRPPKITAMEHAGQVELRVIDWGPGIPNAARDRVFQPFQRLGDRTNHEGVGLGLALSRGLAEAMGGSLVPETTPGGGLTMVLALPSTDADVEPTETRATELADRAIRERLRRWPRDGQVPSRLGTAATPDLAVDEPARPDRGLVPEPVHPSRLAERDAAARAASAERGVGSDRRAGGGRSGGPRRRQGPDPQTDPDRAVGSANSGDSDRNAGPDRGAGPDRTTGTAPHTDGGVGAGSDPGVGSEGGLAAGIGLGAAGEHGGGSGGSHVSGRDRPRRSRGMRHGEGAGAVDEHEDEAGSGHGRTSDGVAADAARPVVRDDPADGRDDNAVGDAGGAGTEGDREPGSSRDRSGTGSGEGGREQVRADERDDGDTPPVGGGR